MDLELCKGYLDGILARSEKLRRWNHKMRRYRRLRLREIELAKILYSTYGFSMQSTASYIGSSKANISNILHKMNSADNAIFRSHKLVANLISKGLDATQYADLIRVTNILARLEVLPQQILIQVRRIVEICYELDIDLRTFVTYFNRFRKFVATIPNKSPEDTQKAIITGLKPGNWFKQVWMY